MNGIDMSYQNGRLIVTADAADKRWQVETSDMSERKWQFLEVSYHPKYGLILYKDGVSTVIHQHKSLILNLFFLIFSESTIFNGFMLLWFNRRYINP